METSRPQPTHGGRFRLAEHLPRLVARWPVPPRPVPWWQLVRSTIGAGFALGALILGSLVALLLELSGGGIEGPALAAVAGAVVLGAVLDLVRLVRRARLVRGGVMATATVEAGPGAPARGGGEIRGRRVATGDTELHARVRLPVGAPSGGFEQTVLLDPRGRRVRATLTRTGPLELRGPRGGDAPPSGPAVELVTLRARLAAALRAGYWTVTASVVAAAALTEALDDPRWWALFLLGLLGAVAAAARVQLRVDERGVRLRSVLWTRRRDWQELDRLDVGEILLTANSHGSRVMTPVLRFRDRVGVQLRAVATVGSWDTPERAEVVRRCERAGLQIDERVRAAVGGGAGSEGR